jgi:hypothetical protein
MKPAFACGVVATAIDVFVKDMRVVSAEARNFLLQTKLSVLQQRYIATMPQLTVPLDRPRYAVTNSLDHVLLYDFAVKRR